MIKPRIIVTGATGKTGSVVTELVNRRADPMAGEPLASFS